MKRSLLNRPCLMIQPCLRAGITQNDFRNGQSRRIHHPAKTNNMWCKPSQCAHVLCESHYLGPSRRGLAWWDGFGVIVVAAPTARNLPTDWLELVRWCITSSEPNAGSQQWAAFVRALRRARPDVTTIISYSDPSHGHTGALYRACNWWWAPTWHRLREPPTGNGRWKSGNRQSVKDRWVFALHPDDRRITILTANDESILRAKPWARYTEPGGADFRKFKESL